MKLMNYQNVAWEQVSKSYKRKTAIGQNLMLTLVRMPTGTHATAHSHPHEQAFWVLAGEMTVRVGAETHRCGVGDLLLVAPNEEHEVWVGEDVEFLTVLTPIREDLLPGKPVPDHLLHDA